jgi:phage-related protein
LKFTLIEELRGEEGFAIYATAEVELFLNNLDDEVCEKTTALLAHVAEYGVPRNREKSKKLVDDVYELKAHQVRLAYVYGQRRRTIMLIHGFTKKSDDWPKNHMKVAKRVCAEVQDAFRKGTVQHGD